MALEVLWHNPEQNIIRVTFPPQWSWNDLYEMDKYTEVLSDTVNHKICYIIDMSQTKITPAGISLQRVREAISANHPNTDLIAVVGIASFVRVMLNTIIRAAGKINSNLVFTETIADAERIIAERQTEIRGENNR